MSDIEDDTPYQNLESDPMNEEENGDFDGDDQRDIGPSKRYDLEEEEEEEDEEEGEEDGQRPKKKSKVWQIFIYALK
jgi:hypothetical protein